MLIPKIIYREVEEMAKGKSFSEQDAYLNKTPPPPDPILTDRVLGDLAEMREAARNTRPKQIQTLLRVLQWAGTAAAAGGAASGQPWGAVALAVLAQVKPLIDQMDPGGELDGRIGMVDAAQFGSTIAEIYRLIREAKGENE